MSRFVLDASVALSWFFEDEAALAAPTLGYMKTGRALVPALWPFEMMNALAVAIRRKRTTMANSIRFLTLLGTFDIEIEPSAPAHVLERILPLALEQDISGYDAAYLELAQRHGLPLATLDRRLQTAAARLGVGSAPTGE